METHSHTSPPLVPGGTQGAGGWSLGPYWLLSVGYGPVAQLPGHQLSGSTECGAEPTPLCGESLRTQAPINVGRKVPVPPEPSHECQNGRWRQGLDRLGLPMAQTSRSPAS